MKITNKTKWPRQVRELIVYSIFALYQDTENIQNSLNKVKNGPKRPYNGQKRAKNA